MSRREDSAGTQNMETEPSSKSTPVGKGEMSASGTGSGTGSDSPSAPPSLASPPSASPPLASPKTEETAKVEETAGGGGEEKSVSSSPSPATDPTAESPERGGTTGWLKRLFIQEPALVSTAFRRSAKTDETGTKVKSRKLGLMLGVYLPSIQNVFGVIMFLRLCWMVGVMGVGEAFIMVFLCCLVTFLTTLSVSAIATNGVVESGGTYLMISRSLGPHLGVACGILFYLANTIAVAMYIVGGLEIFLNYMAPKAFLWGVGEESPDADLLEIRNNIPHIFGVYNNHVRLYGIPLLLFTLLVVSLGVRVVQFFAPFSLLGVIISILAIYAGTIEKSAVPQNRPKVCINSTQTTSLLLTTKACGKTNQSQDFCHICNECPSLRTSANDLTTECTDALTGFSFSTFRDNSYSKYSASKRSAWLWSRKDGVHGNRMRVEKKAKKDGEEKMVVTTEVTTFFAMMGIYFPSVTGILTGSNMSGDLADPQRTIPLGTLAAQLTTTFVYLSFVVIFGASVPPGVLLDKNGSGLDHRMVIAELAWPNHWVVVIGCFLSTFGAGLQSLCSAPRLLASIAKDGVIPGISVFARLNCWNEPWVALLFTTAISFVCLMIAKLDLVAPLVANFFLQLYAFVNLACAGMSLINSPGWRPHYRAYHWSLSLFGFFLAYFIMFSTFWIYASITCAIGLGIVLLVAWKGRVMEWGDGTQGLLLSLAQFFLYKLEGGAAHPKNWRPQLLLMCQGESPETLGPSLLFLHQFKASKGLVMVADLVEEETEDKGLEQATERAQSIREELAKANIHGFVETVFYRKDRLSGILSTLLQTMGISNLKPNTLLMPWPVAKMEDKEGHVALGRFLDRLHRAATHGYCLMCVKGLELWPKSEERMKGPVDVWWIVKDGGLLLLVAHLLRKDAAWADTRLRLFLVTESAEGAEGAETESAELRETVEKMLYQLRLSGEVKVVSLPAGDTVAYRRAEGDEKRERDAVLRGLEPKEAERVAHRDPQMVAESAIAAHSSVRTSFMDDLFSDRDTNSFLQSHPASQFTFSRRELTAGIPDDASYRFSSGGQSEQSPVVSRSFTAGSCKSARALNRHIRRHSSDVAALVVLNLPRPPRFLNGMRNYRLYMDILLYNLNRVILVRGTGKEVITIYQ